MAARVRCPTPSCGQETSVPEDQLGRAARCPACQTEYTPAPVAEPDVPSLSLDAREEPRQVARFRLRERLQGGTPSVYRAADPVLGRELRLKLYPSPPAQLAELVRTHRAVTELRHPAILPVQEIG